MLRRSYAFARYLNYVRLSGLRQASTSSRTIEHQQNLSRLQAIDQVHLQQVKDQLATLTKSAQAARSHVGTLFTDIQLLPEIPPYTLHALTPRKSAALSAADELLKRAQALRDHLEDLEREPYPEYNADVVVDKDWEGRVLRMSEEERKDELYELEATIPAMRHSVSTGLAELEKRFERVEDERDRVGMPFKAVDGKKVEAKDEVRKTGFGLGEEEGAEVKTAAEQKPEVKKVEEERPKKKGFGLGDLQKKLEERAKDIWRR